MARKRKFGAPPFDSINLTPLIDTLFFLLIIFMVTAPLLEYNVDVSPPEMNADELTEDQEKSHVVNLRADGTLSYRNMDMTAEQFFHELSDLRHDPEARVFLRADRSLDFGSVIDFLAGVKRSGFTNIYLVTVEESKQ